MGHVQDRWYRPKKDPVTGEVATDKRGKPLREKSELYGIGDRYKARYVDPSGSERSKSFPDRCKKQADDFLLAVENDKREDRYIDPTAARRLFRTQAESWIKGQSDDPATRQILASRLNKRILPVLGDKPVGKIAASTIRDWMDTIAGYSENYKAVLFTLVSSVLDSAIDDRLIRDNPCRAKSIQRPTAAAITAKDIWSEDRVRSVESGLPDRWKIVVPIGAGCGLRQGEILGLSPDDIDRDAMVLNVRRQLRLVNGTLVFSAPKRNKTRVVPLARGVLARLDKHMEDAEPVSVTLPWRKPSGDEIKVKLLCTRDDDKLLYSGDLFTKTLWAGAFRVSNLTRIKQVDGIHALRHFYASTLLAQGVSIKELAAYLGHSDPGFTLRVYTHLVSTSYERARLAMDTVFTRPDPADGLEAA
ncbi:MAG TPA: site-specific integrase [Actinokineospora sp.]|jgi:integrase|nr:site-specific integrase [Actinokineospora sp.]